MKALIGSLAALALMASPAVAAQKAATTSTKTVTTKSGNTKATTTVSTKGSTTTAKTTMSKAKKSHRMGRRHHAARCTCSHYGKAKMHKKGARKASAKKTATTTK